jgi:hypothetical protein
MQLYSNVYTETNSIPSQAKLLLKTTKNNIQKENSFYSPIYKEPNKNLLRNREYYENKKSNYRRLLGKRQVVKRAVLEF